jgi:hypothetical protein
MSILARLSHPVAVIGGTASKAAALANRGIIKVRHRVNLGVSRVTGVNYDWSRAILSVGSATNLVGQRRALRGLAQSWLHPNHSSHLAVFDSINRAIDSDPRFCHRLFRGHSIEWLPSLVREFGPRAIPAYAAHLAQDFTTPQGIPLIPWAGAVYPLLVSAGLRKARAATLLSINLAGATAFLGTAVVAYEVTCLLREIYRQKIASPPVV